MPATAAGAGILMSTVPPQAAITQNTMSAILIISDLHLGDKRNSPVYEEQMLQQLSALLKERPYQAVLNLGDTVSRLECLREGASTAAVFAKYKNWRAGTGIPFRECCIYRERAFFSGLFQQAPDSAWHGIPGVVILTFAPDDPNDHQGTQEQWEWLAEQLHQAHGKTVLIGSHVPYPGSCSRPIAPGIYLPVPVQTQALLAGHNGAVFWAGGHFHWQPDPPLVQGSLTACMGACFAFAGETTRRTYVRELDLQTLSIQTLTNGSAEKSSDWNWQC